MTRDIFVISDLHMGDGGPRDSFDLHGRTGQLMGFLDFVGSEGGELYVLGDLFELWLVNLSRTLVARRPLLDRLAALDSVYVPGNHDIDLIAFVGTQELAHPFFTQHMRLPFTRVLGGREFKFFHGHEVDPFNRGEEPSWGRMFAIFAGIFEQENRSPVLRGGRPIEAVLGTFGDSMLALWSSTSALVRRELATRGARNPDPERGLTPAQNPDRFAEHVLQIRGNLESERYEVAVFGHTHKPGRIGDWYFNSGTWKAPFNPFLRISPKGEVRYFHWQDGRASPQELPVLFEEAQVERLRRLQPAPAAQPRGKLGAMVDTVRTLVPRAPLHPAPPRGRAIRVLRGVLAVLFGLGALARFRGDLDLLLWGFAAYALIDGGLSVAAGLRARLPVPKLAHLLQGGLGLLVGAVAVARPTFSLELLVFLMGAWAVAVGGLRIAAGMLLRGLVSGRTMAAGGALTVVAGFALMVVPQLELPVVLTVAGVWLVGYGLAQIVIGALGRRLR